MFDKAREWVTSAKVWLTAAIIAASEFLLGWIDALSKVFG